MLMISKKDLALENTVEGKVIYLLALIIVAQFGYPVTAYGTVALIVYEIIYASMIFVGILLGRDSRWHTVFLTLTGVVYLAASQFYIFNPGANWAVRITYLALIPYLGMLVWILVRFLVVVSAITRDVIYAAVALYLLIGAIFVPIYGLLNFLIPGSFRDGSYPGLSVQWQQLVYYSYTTLTSTGYGELLPISWWARSIANLEMVAGGLYITIVMSRLVGLYKSENRKERT
ncbi:MAG: hypothetical protein OHK0041_11680 [Anaerolineales bacterium]